MRCVFFTALPSCLTIEFVGGQEEAVDDVTKIRKKVGGIALKKNQARNSMDIWDVGLVGLESE